VRHPPTLEIGRPHAFLAHQLVSVVSAPVICGAAANGDGVLDPHALTTLASFIEEQS
jgi:hypothetical protein